MESVKNGEVAIASSQTITVASRHETELEDWLAIRKKTGSMIDPETAEVTWVYANTFDPYGVHPDLPEDAQCAGRENFARMPGSDVWVWFGDLPDEVHDRLIKKHGAKLNFPEGLIMGRETPGQ